MFDHLLAVELEKGEGRWRGGKEREGRSGREREENGRGEKVPQLSAFCNDIISSSVPLSAHITYCYIVIYIFNSNYTMHMRSKDIVIVSFTIPTREYDLQQSAVSLIPRPSLLPVFDRLQYAKMEGED